MTISEAALKLRAGGAYRLFVSEAQKYMDATSVLNGSIPSDDDCKMWSMRFHTLKGSAGFFQLTEIADVAGALEKDFIAPNLQEIWERVTENIAKMRVLVEQMPEPAPAPPTQGS